ncbi:MAG: site-specific integrase [Acidobacteria bacterium]|nr:site-specific integrase [Acidobacteriota bacterium]
MTVRKRGSRWWFDFRLQGTRHRGPIAEARTKAQAEQAEAKIRTEFYEGRYGRTRLTPKLTEWIGETYLPWAQSNKRSWYDDELIAKTICAYFKDMRLGDVNSLHVEKFKRDRRETPTKQGSPRQPATVNRELAVLSKVFQLAVDAGQIESNPCQRVKRLRHDNSRTRFLSKEEEARLLEQLMGKEPLRSIVVLALNTGMRRGEILSLRWGDVDLQRRLIHVKQTKTARNRTVPVNRDAYEMLSSQLHESELVFVSRRTGRQLVEIKKGFTAACGRANIHDFHFHDLRHTAASRLAETGADITTIAEILGHSSLSMTKRYTHSNEDRKRRALDAMVTQRNVVTIWSQKEKRQASGLP